ncbi:MAG: hypothetical protein WC484_06790 [Candidatus Omnitrophota bacterium]
MLVGLYSFEENFGIQIGKLLKNNHYNLSVPLCTGGCVTHVFGTNCFVTQKLQMAGESFMFLAQPQNLLPPLLGKNPQKQKGLARMIARKSTYL